MVHWTFPVIDNAFYSVVKRRIKKYFYGECYKIRGQKFGIEMLTQPLEMG